MCVPRRINYDADRQRQHFRKTNGQSLIWGKPAIAIEVCIYVFTKAHPKTFNTAKERERERLNDWHSIMCLDCIV